MTDEADDEPYFFVTPDKDWPEAYFAIVARDEDGRGYEFCGKIVTLELAESIAAFLNRSSNPPEFPDPEDDSRTDEQAVDPIHAHMTHMI
jgi:hypothetical protein